MDRQEYWEEDNLLIQVGMLGGFSIRIGETVIKDTSSRSSQLWSLLEYLIAFRHKTISPEEIYEALWGEDEIENPASALKNLVYRVRTVFTKAKIPFAKKIITYAGGTYRWNNSIPCVVDVEEFEELQKKAGSLAQPTELRIENYLRAIDLYQGDFLTASGFKSWIMPVSSYYKSVYFRCVFEVLQLLEKEDRFREMETICRKALMVDQFEETAHQYLILSLVRQGQQSQAVAHYKLVTDLFMRELGVQPSASLRSFYRETAKTINSVEIDVGIIQQDLRETESGEGAFYCEYDIFKNVYQILARTATRIGQSIYVALFTVTDSKGGMPDKGLRKKAMEGLFRVIQVSTRRCDVFARFSASQYVVILPTTSMENCDIVKKRIFDTYKEFFPLPDVKLHAAIQMMDLDG